jgi:hypothetical protein
MDVAAIERKAEAERLAEQAAEAKRRSEVQQQLAKPAAATGESAPQ